MMTIVDEGGAPWRKPERGNEGSFYVRLARELPCRTPRLLGRDGGELLLERLPRSRPLADWTPADFLSGARLLALVHGAFWDMTALPEEQPWLPLEAATRPVALVHGDFRPGHIHMAEDGTKWVISWRRVRLGDPAAELADYAATAPARLGFGAILSAYLEVLQERMEVDADPLPYLDRARARRHPT